MSHGASDGSNAAARLVASALPRSVAPCGGCQLFLASHYINDQKKFKATMDTVTPEMMPAGVTSHAFLPSADGHTAFCVWEAADGVDYTTIRTILNDFEGVTSTLTPVDDPWGVFECSA